MAQLAPDCPPRKKMALALTESLRLQTLDALANPRARRIVVGFLPRDPATLVSNSWRLARDQQTTRMRCKWNGTDAAVISLATHCPSLNDVNLYWCSNITKMAVAKLRESHLGIYIDDDLIDGDY